MNLLVTGCHGQVGTELMRQAESLGHRLTGLDRVHLDITEAAAVREAIARQRPDAVINAAAYTAVDRAESDRATAFAVNRDGAANLASACADAGIPFVHYSTDYVFDGRKTSPYVETDPVAPRSIYGESKLAGEEAVREACPQHLILRTSWVFSSHGHNFVKTMLRLGGERESLSVVADQQGKPTSAAELARLTLAALSRRDGRWGTYHLAQPDATTWHAFAEAIFAEAAKQGIGLQVDKVKPIVTADYPTLAERPANSVLDCRHFEAVFGEKIRPWKASLAEAIAELRHA